MAVSRRISYFRQKHNLTQKQLGLLLGYPAEDVRGFMGIGYKKCLYTGYWKVYEKAEEKIALFSE